MRPIAWDGDNETETAAPRVAGKLGTARSFRLLSFSEIVSQSVPVPQATVRRRDRCSR